MIRLSKVVLVLLLVVCALSAGRGAAQVSPATVEGARALYVEGLTLRQDGDLTRSLERLRAAHALYATPIITLELGRALGLLARYDEARTVLATVEQLPRKANESDKAASARAEAARLMVTYEQAAASATAVVEPAPAVRTPSAAAPPAPAPGAAEAPAQAAPPRSIAPAAVGDETSAPGHNRTSVASTPLPAPRKDAELRSTRLLYSGLGLSGAGLAVGAATGLTTLIRAHDLRARCDGNTCPPGSGVETTQRVGVAANVAFAAAGVGVALAIVAVFVQRRTAHARAHDGRGLHLTFGPTTGGSVTW